MYEDIQDLMLTQGGREIIAWLMEPCLDHDSMVDRFGQWYGDTRAACPYCQRMILSLLQDD